MRDESQMQARRGIGGIGGIGGMAGTSVIRLALRYSLALVAGLMLALYVVVAPTQAHPARPVQPAHAYHAYHAYPVREDPAAHALLQTPPSGVTIEFSEDVNPATSRIVVVDTTNREVDDRDSQVSSTNGHILSVTLPLLPAGTYVVVWKVQSADDGHVTGGSYYFQVARPDGTAPPIPAQLPAGNVPGAGGVGAQGTTLDGPTVLQAIGTWLALLFATFWVGGVIWETWILPPGKADLDPDLAAAATSAGARFRQFAAPALALILLSDVVIVLGQAAALAGDWSGLTSPPLLRAILFGSRFGFFWWARELTALVALVVLVVATHKGWSWTRERTKAPDVAPEQGASDGTEPIAAAQEVAPIPDWRRELVHTLEGIQYLPRRLAEGWRGRTPVGRVELVLAILLLLAFALSGHAAAVPATIFLPAIAVDLLHLLGDAAWLGGLFYIGIVLVPALTHLPLLRRARVLALGLPHFGALAILSAAILAATGSLNATIRMSSFAQLFTTAYGRTLAIKIELFLIMAAISAFHAFWLRPRLAATLTSAPPSTLSATETATEGALVRVRGNPQVPAREATSSGDGASRQNGDDAVVSTGEPADRAGIAKLSTRLEGWLRREAILGVGVLVCVALLGAYAGTLAVAPPSAPAQNTTGPYVSSPQQAGPYTVILKVVPASFGPNTFVVTVKDAQGHPVNGAGVLVQTTMLDMDMGTQNVNLTSMGSDAPGGYSGQGDLDMGGNWGVVVKVLPPGGSDYVSTSFKFAVGY